MQINEADLPKGPDKFALFTIAIEHLIGAGYAPIGMDHFALPEDELAQGLENGRLHRNFMGYTVSLSRDMLGLGLSSIGEIGGCFAQNDSRLGGYYRRIDDQGYGVYRGWSLTRDDEIRREAILAIMCRMHLNLNEITEKFDIDAKEYFADAWPKLKEFADDGLIDLDDSGFSVKPMGRHFVRNVAMLFDAHLAGLQQGATSKKPIFSRTV
jgi:oxygen-independent coproporphyrinogen-3 oxidase